MKLSDLMQSLMELRADEMYPCERGIPCPFLAHFECYHKCDEAMAQLAKELVTKQ